MSFIQKPRVLLIGKSPGPTFPKERYFPARKGAFRKDRKQREKGGIRIMIRRLTATLAAALCVGPLAFATVTATAAHADTPAAVAPAPVATPALATVVAPAPDPAPVAAPDPAPAADEPAPADTPATAAANLPPGDPTCTVSDGIRHCVWQDGSERYTTYDPTSDTTGIAWTNKPTRDHATRDYVVYQHHTPPPCVQRVHYNPKTDTYRTVKDTCAAAA